MIIRSSHGHCEKPPLLPYQIALLRVLPTSLEDCVLIKQSAKLFDHCMAINGSGDILGTPAAIENSGEHEARKMAILD